MRHSTSKMSSGWFKHFPSQPMTLIYLRFENESDFVIALVRNSHKSGEAVCKMSRRVDGWDRQLSPVQSRISNFASQMEK
jgi:hypothetical protein